MAKLSKALRFEILARDGFRCQYCGTGAKDTVLHVDHIKPLAKGGTNDHDNLQAACADCNHGKADRSLIPNRAGFDLTPDQRPARLAKMRKGQAAAKLKQPHVLDTDAIDQYDEFNGDYQLCLVWCRTHQSYEWHSLDVDDVDSGVFVTLTSDPIS